MITRTLWRALAAPPVDHPLFRRVNASVPGARNWIGVWLVLGVGTAIVFLCSVVSSALRWTAVALPLLPLVLPLLVNLRALGWSLDVADAVGRERERETWDLLRLLPRGGLWSGWTVACAWIYRHDTFTFVKGLVQSVLAIGGGLVIVITLVATITFEPARFRNLTADQLPGVFMIASAAIIVLLYIDFVQTLVLAAIVGLYAGNSAKTREDARALAASLFAVIQMSIYMAATVIGWGIMPGLFSRLGWTGLVPLISLVVFRFVLLCGTREIVLLALWRRLVDQLGGEALAPQVTL